MSAFVKNRLGYKMTTAIFLQFFFTYTVTVVDHFGPNYIYCKGLQERKGILQFVGRGSCNSHCMIGPYGRAVSAIGLKLSAFVKNRLGYKMTLTAIFLQCFFAYTVTIADHFGPNYVYCKGLEERKGILQFVGRGSRNSLCVIGPYGRAV